MKLRLPLFAAAISISVAGLALPTFAAPSAHPARSHAKGDKKKDKQKSKSLPMPGPRGLKFGLKLDQLSDFYEKYWDSVFLKRFKSAAPGVETQALEAELRDVKRLIKRTHLKFGKTPTGIDQTPLKGEYSYLNGESMSRLQIDRDKRRFFFFFESRGVWKIYDEYQLGKKSKLGSTFDEAVEVLTKMFGHKAKRLDADFANGRPLPEAVWEDEKIIIRAVNRDYQNIVGLVYVDKSTQRDLANLRRNQPPKEELDPAVKNVTKKEPPPGQDDQKKKRK